jgi:hypothetical protein
MSTGEPLQTLGQIWLWRLEAEVLAALIALALGGLWLLAYCTLGDRAAGLVFDIGFGGLVLAVPGCLIWGLCRVLNTRARFRQSDKALTAYLAGVDRLARGEH